MSNKNKKRGGMVYSTNPGFEFEDKHIEIETLPPEKQNLLVRISTQGRAGKKATLVQRFQGRIDDLENLSKELKKHCSVGGTVKNNEIIIQGDFCDKVVSFLLSKGYKAKKG
ncbi:MAG: translation initiation factor [Bacteroidia bacterium]|nr:translation initiation factor [Bacteroidia bacterium]